MRLIRSLPTQRGDTIIEVLIAIAVASSVLAVTYATMNRNLNTTRASQERSEASKLAQGQIEALKARSDAGVTSIPSNSFCIDDTGTELPIANDPDPLLDVDDFLNYETAGCVSPQPPEQPIYHYAITYVSATTYRFYVRWDRIGGGRDQVIMVYKL